MIIIARAERLNGRLSRLSFITAMELRSSINAEGCAHAFLAS